MQAVYLISHRGFDEKQIGTLLLVFGLSQFLCMAPAGYLMDYSQRKLQWVSFAGLACSVLTVITVLAADEDNFGWMILIKVLQGAFTAIVPPGFHGITMGIVGSTGFTHQVAQNRMMTHIGTALIVTTGSILAYFLYPNIGVLFTVSPIAALFVWYYLCQIAPKDVHKDAARGLVIESPTMTDYEYADDIAACKQEATRMGGSSLSWDRSESSANPQEDMMYSPTAAFGSRRTPPPVEIRDRSGSLGRPNRTTSDLTNITEGRYNPPYMLPAGLEPPVTTGSSHRDCAQQATPIDPRASVLSPALVIDNEEANASQGGKKSESSMPSFQFGWAAQSSAVRDDHVPYTPLEVLFNPKLIIFTAVIFFFHLSNNAVLPLVMQTLALSDVQSGILMSGLCILIGQTFMAIFAKMCGDYSSIWGRKNLILVGLVSLTLRCFLLTLLVSAEDYAKTPRGNLTLKILVLSTQFLDSVGAGILGTLQILVTSDLSVGTGRFSLLLGVTTAAMCLGATVSSYLGQAAAHDYGYPFAFSALGLISLIPFVMYIFLMPETLPDFARSQHQKRRKRLRELWRNLKVSRQRILNPFGPESKAVDQPGVDSSPLADVELV